MRQEFFQYFHRAAAPASVFSPGETGVFAPDFGGNGHFPPVNLQNSQFFLPPQVFLVNTIKKYENGHILD
jgi:hypothetical protein